MNEVNEMELIYEQENLLLDQKREMEICDKCKQHKTDIIEFVDIPTGEQNIDLNLCSACADEMELNEVLE